jgi:hypothetical protein
MPQDRRRDRHANRRSPINKPFVGVDGEGGNFDTGHEYMLLRAGSHVIETGEPLTWRECLPFLADLPKGVIYVAYFFDYDVTMCLRGLPRERIARLLDIDCRRIAGKPCSSWPIDFEGFQIDYLPGKEFRVRRKGKGNRWTIISDVGSFFQSSFVKALRRWFSEPDPDGGEPIIDPRYAPIIERIELGKAQRNEFGAVTEDEREYNKLEIAMLERLMEKFRDVCTELDIRPNRWQGPGTLVSAVFKRESLPRNDEIPFFDAYPDVARMANDAYYGGRFEVSQFGDIPGPIFQYDINSAYAATYRGLPCLLHGTWRHFDGMPLSVDERIPESERPLYLADTEFEHGLSFRWCTLPIRTHNGTLVWPRMGRAVYWDTELRVAERHGVKLTYHGGWLYERHCECETFRFVQEAYDERRRLGKDGKGMVLKIFLASTYGKLAQSVGCAPYSNPVWAGRIVSTVRAHLIDAALTVDKGESVLMLATDGLFTTKPIPSLPLGTELGQWELTVHDDIFIVQSGVYFLRDKKPKTRGIPQSRVIDQEADFRRVWHTYLNDAELGRVEISLQSFVGLRLALARNKPELAGQWIPNPKQITFDWHSKRSDPTITDTRVVTRPMDGNRTLISVPYQRVIGGINAARTLDFADQPDWGDQL